MESVFKVIIVIARSTDTGCLMIFKLLIQKRRDARIVNRAPLMHHAAAASISSDADGVRDADFVSVVDNGRGEGDTSFYSLTGSMTGVELEHLRRCCTCGMKKYLSTISYMFHTTLIPIRTAD